jgi:hypothetical protein
VLRFHRSDPDSKSAQIPISPLLKIICLGKGNIAKNNSLMSRTPGFAACSIQSPTAAFPQQGPRDLFGYGSKVQGYSWADPEILPHITGWHDRRRGVPVEFAEGHRALFTDEWKKFIFDSYGSLPSITYFECPVIVDNAIVDIFTNG